MRDSMIETARQDPTSVYRIIVRGHVGPTWEDWFDGFTIAAQKDGNTHLTGEVPDQAALFGLLRKVQNLGLPLVSVKQATKEEGDEAAN